MDDQNLYEDSESADIFRKIRYGVGLALSVAGAIMALYIFLMVYRLIKNPSQIELFTRMMPDDPNIRNLDMGDKTIKIPMGVFYFFAYFIMVLLMLVASSIGIGFIKLGVGLMYPRVDKLEAKLYRETMSLNNKIMELKARFVPLKPGQKPPAGEGEFSFGMKHPEEK